MDRNKKAGQQELKARISSGKILFAIGLASLLISLCHPFTGWVSRYNLDTAGHGIGPVLLQAPWDNVNQPAQLPDLVSPPLGEPPTEFHRQFAAALTAPGIDAEHPFGPAHSKANDILVVDRLLVLSKRFPNRPELLSAILRTLCSWSGPHVSREEAFWLDHRADHTSDSWFVEEQRHDQDPLRIHQFLAVAIAGERCDPNNAFFPQMQAIALFMQHRDWEAIIALGHAARKPIWNDYTGDDINVRLQQLVYENGEESVVPRSILIDSFCYSHVPCLRDVARLAVYQAARQEQAGCAIAGFLIRRDIAHLGALMRVQSRHFVGNQCGVAITLLAARRPGGLADAWDPYCGSYMDRVDPQVTQQGVAAYVSYLKQIGQPEEAHWYVADRARGVLFAERRKSFTETEGLDPRFSKPLAELWMVGPILLTDCLLILLFGRLAGLLCHLRHIHTCCPLPPGVRSGFVLFGSAAAFLVLFAMILQTGEAQPADIAWMVRAGTVEILLLAFLLKRGTSWKGYGRRLAGMVCAFASACAVSLYCFRLYALVLAVGVSHLIWETEPVSPAALPILIALVVAGPPAALLAGAGVSLKQRHPVSAGMIRYFRDRSMAWSGVLLFLAGLVAYPVAALEQERRAMLGEMISHEGRYLARKAGVSWPGSVGEGK